MNRETTHTLMVRIDERQKAIHADIQDMKKLFDKHIKDDRVDFAALRKEVHGMSKYAASISAISVAVGGAGVWIFRTFAG